MIVGRGRSMIVGARGGAHGGASDEISELMGYSTGQHHGGGGDGGSPPDYPDYPAAGPAAYHREGRTHVIELEPKHIREFPIGFTSPDGSPVPAGGIQNIQALPQVLFRGERLAIPNSIVLNFQLADIKVGKNSQLAAPGNLPTECFSNISIGVRMQLESAEPGITITLSVQNTDLNNSHPFSGVLYGTVMEI